MTGGVDQIFKIIDLVDIRWRFLSMVLSLMSKTMVMKRKIRFVKEPSSHRISVKVALIGQNNEKKLRTKFGHHLDEFVD